MRKTSYTLLCILSRVFLSRALKTTGPRSSGTTVLVFFKTHLERLLSVDKSALQGMFICKVSGYCLAELVSTHAMRALDRKQHAFLGKYAGLIKCTR